MDPIEALAQIGLEPLSKHAQHDQSSHGRRGGRLGRAVSARRTKRARRRALKTATTRSDKKRAKRMERDAHRAQRDEALEQALRTDWDRSMRAAGLDVDKIRARGGTASKPLLSASEANKWSRATGDPETADWKGYAQL